MGYLRWGGGEAEGDGLAVRCVSSLSMMSVAGDGVNRKLVFKERRRGKPCFKV